MGVIDYKTLREIQQKEVSSPKLSSLEENFYQTTAKFLEDKKCEAFSSNSITKIREYENLQKIIAIIKEKREEKILLMALRNEKINGYLTPEEKVFFENLVKALNDFRNSINQKTETVCESEALKVKVIKDIDAYKGLDGKIYGPFKQDEIVSLPKAEVEWLIKAKLAEMLVIK